MSRTTYVYRTLPEGGVEVFEKGAEHEAARGNDAGVLWGDLHYANITGPMGEDLSTRSKHRAYMKEKGLSMVCDWTNEWETARKKREEHLTTGGDHKARREQVERAMYELSNRK
jgi:hypothetical protein